MHRDNQYMADRIRWAVQRLIDWPCAACCCMLAPRGACAGVHASPVRPRGRRLRQGYACARARAKNFPEFFRCQTGGRRGRGIDQKFLKDIPQFCMFSSVVHAEFCWICGLFPQYARVRIFRPRARVYPCARPNFCKTCGVLSPAARARMVDEAGVIRSMRQG